MKRLIVVSLLLVLLAASCGAALAHTRVTARTYLPVITYHQTLSQPAYYDCLIIERQWICRP